LLTKEIIFAKHFDIFTAVVRRNTKQDLPRYFAVSETHKDDL